MTALWAVSDFTEVTTSLTTLSHRHTVPTTKILLDDTGELPSKVGTKLSTSDLSVR